MKLYEILTTFDVYTLNRFRKYVASPFFNEKEAVLRLCDGLLPILKKRLNGGIIKLPKKTCTNINESLKIKSCYI